MLPEALASLRSFDPSTLSKPMLYIPLLTERKTPAQIAARVCTDAEIWCAALSDSLDRTFNGSERLDVLVELATAVFKEDKTEQTRDQLKSWGVKADDPAYDALSKLEQRLIDILHIRTDGAFIEMTQQHSQENPQEMTPQTIGRITSNSALANKNNITGLLMTPYPILEQIILGFDQTDFIEYKGLLDLFHAVWPSYLKNVLIKLNGRMQHVLREYEEKVTDALDMHKQLPLYLYSYAQLQEFDTLRDEVRHHQEAVMRLNVLLKNVQTAQEQVVGAYAHLLEEMTIDNIVSIMAKKAELNNGIQIVDDHDELFDFTSEWEGFRYPEDYRSTGVYGDITDSEFSKMSQLEANRRCKANLEHLGLKNYLDFKNALIFNRLMLSEFLARPEIRSKINALQRRASQNSA